MVRSKVEDMIFVFGSNAGGKHGAGAARFALKNRGAVYGNGHGMQGRSYAIATLDEDLNNVPFTFVQSAVEAFLHFARSKPKESFQVTRVGCGLAGYEDKEIAPLFVDAPDNCYFDEAWRPWLGDDVMYWGTFESKSTGAAV